MNRLFYDTEWASNRDSAKVMPMDDESIAQLQCLAGCQDFFNDEEDKVLIDDVVDNRALHIRHNRELIERFKEEMLMRIELSETLTSKVEV